MDVQHLSPWNTRAVHHRPLCLYNTTMHPSTTIRGEQRNYRGSFHNQRGMDGKWFKEGRMDSPRTSECVFRPPSSPSCTTLLFSADRPTRGFRKKITFSGPATDAAGSVPSCQNRAAEKRGSKHHTQARKFLKNIDFCVRLCLCLCGTIPLEGWILCIFFFFH